MVVPSVKVDVTALEARTVSRCHGAGNRLGDARASCGVRIKRDRRPACDTRIGHNVAGARVPEIVGDLNREIIGTDAKRDICECERPGGRIDHGLSNGIDAAIAKQFSECAGGSNERCRALGLCIACERHARQAAGLACAGQVNNRLDRRHAGV